MKEKESVNNTELSNLSNALDVTRDEKAVAIQEMEKLRIQLQSVESERGRLQGDLTISEGRVLEVKESAKAQLQKAMDKIRAMTAAVDSKNQQLDDLSAQLDTLRQESQAKSADEEERRSALQIRVQTLEDELEKTLQAKVAADERCTELQSSLESTSSSTEANLYNLEQQLKVTLNKLAEVGLNEFNSSGLSNFLSLLSWKKKKVLFSRTDHFNRASWKPNGRRSSSLYKK